MITLLIRPCVSQSSSALPLRSCPGFGIALIVVFPTLKIASAVRVGVGHNVGLRVGASLGPDVGVGSGVKQGVEPGVGLAVRLGVGLRLAVGSG